MNYENFKTGFNTPAVFSAQTYGTKTTVEVDHSDLSLDEVMDAFKTLIVGMGYDMDSFNQWVKEMADELREGEPQPNYDDEYQNLRHSFEDKPYYDWDDNTTNEDWLHMEEPENEDKEEEVKWPEPNEELKEAAEQYDKKMNAAPKKRKKKTVEDWENEIDLGGRE